MESPHAHPCSALGSSLIGRTVHGKSLQHGADREDFLQFWFQSVLTVVLHQQYLIASPLSSCVNRRSFLSSFQRCSRALAGTFCCLCTQRHVTTMGIFLSKTLISFHLCFLVRNIVLGGEQDGDAATQLCHQGWMNMVPQCFPCPIHRAASAHTAQEFSAYSESPLLITLLIAKISPYHVSLGFRFWLVLGKIGRQGTQAAFMGTGHREVTLIWAMFPVAFKPRQSS